MTIEQLDNIDFGHQFWHRSHDYIFVDICTQCGTKRKKGEHDWSYNSDKYCSGCGRSLSESVISIKPFYVIGKFERFDGKKGFQLSDKKPEEIGDGTYSYWSYEFDQLGKEFFATKKEIELL